MRPAVKLKRREIWSMLYTLRSMPASLTSRLNPTAGQHIWKAARGEGRAEQFA